MSSQSEPEPKPRPRPSPEPVTVFVGGICKLTSEDRLKAYLSQFGQILSINIVKDEYGFSRGFGFVAFHDASILPGLLSTIHVLDRKQLEVTRARSQIDYGEVRNTTKRWGAGSFSVHLSNLHCECTEEEVKTAIAAYGVVGEVRLLRKGEDGSSITAIVRFESLLDPNRFYNESIFIHGKRVSISPLTGKTDRHFRKKKEIQDLKSHM